MSENEKATNSLEEIDSLVSENEKATNNSLEQIDNLVSELQNTEWKGIAFSLMLTREQQV